MRISCLFSMVCIQKNQKRRAQVFDSSGATKGSEGSEVEGRSSGQMWYGARVGLNDTPCPIRSGCWVGLLRSVVVGDVLELIQNMLRLRGTQKRYQSRGWSGSHGVEEPCSEAMLTTPTTGSQIIQSSVDMVWQKAISRWAPFMFL